MLRPLLPNFGPVGSLANTGLVAGQRITPSSVLQPATDVLEISARTPLAKTEKTGPLCSVTSVLTCPPPMRNPAVEPLAFSDREIPDAGKHKPMANVEVCVALVELRLERI